jgi:hypothetical protein
MRARVLAVLVASLALGVSLLAQDPPGLHLVPACPTGTKAITSIARCDDVGCGGVADAGLNTLKNRTDAPSGTFSTVNVQGIYAFYEPIDG